MERFSWLDMVPRTAAENKAVALLIAVLALFLAIAETAAKSAQTEALSANIEAANLWSFFQARTIRQTTVRTAAEAAALTPGRRRARPRSSAGTRPRRVGKASPKPAKVRRELMARARAAEARRDRSMERYHMFEYASAGFQVGIVVASASIITGVALLVWGGVGLGVLGVGLAALGFFAPGDDPSLMGFNRPPARPSPQPGTGSAPPDPRHFPPSAPASASLASPHPARG